MLILVILVALGIALGSVSQDFHAGVLGLNDHPLTGTLVVRVVNGTGAQETPIPGASVIIDAGAKYSELLTTDSNGEVQAELLVGNHTLAVFNTQFSTSGSFSIQNKDTTTAEVQVSAYVVRPIFTDFADPDNTGYDNSWQPITTAVNSSSANTLLTSAAVYFNTVYAPGANITSSTASSSTTHNSSSSPATDQVRAILYSQPVNGTAAGLWWISWEPTVPIPLNGLTGLTLSVYSASIEVQTNGN